MSDPSTRVRVLLAEGNGLASAALRDVIKSIADLDLVWDVHEISETLRLVEQVQPDLILLAHSLVKSELVAIVRAIAEKSPRAEILLLSTHNDSRFALRAIEAGASGYMLKDRILEELPKAVKTVMAGWTYLSPGIAGMARGGRAVDGSLRTLPKNRKRTPPAELAQPSGRHGGAPRLENNGKLPSLLMSPHERPAKPPRFLVVDDEESIRVTFGSIFERAGYAVVTAATAEDAIAALRRELPDIAFVDLVMPGASGVEVIKAIRALDETLPVVVVTGYPDSDLMHQAMAYSPLLVLGKPVRAKMLLDTARSALAGRLAQTFTNVEAVSAEQAPPFGENVQAAAKRKSAGGERE